MLGSLPLAHLEAKFLFDGETYEVEQFHISFGQPVDFKGQPQHEVKGGMITLGITHVASDDMYLWAKKPTSLKDGVILFQTDMGITVLELAFMNAYCMNLTRQINASRGTSTVLVISPETINFNGVKHTNEWV